MTELEKMQRYISRTKMSDSDRFYLDFHEAMELARTAVQTKDDAVRIIALAFNFGKAKGYRAAKREVRARTNGVIVNMLQQMDMRELDLVWRIVYGMTRREENED